MPLITLPGVYAPQDDTALLAETLRREPLEPGARVLDIGTGTGALALAAARRGGEVTAVDISRRAVLAARINARLAGLPVRVVRGNLLAPVAGRSYELLLTNPPYVPAPAAVLPRRGSARAWDAGNDGRLLLDRICRDAPGLLAPGGVLLMVHSALSGTEPTLRMLRAAGLAAVVVEHRYVPFGPVLRSRQGWLHSQGLMAPDDEKEELVVIRAERSA
ncbi:HemK2/MTQ2 family protein methyltransferase [Streptomyces niger]|uniref:HemK2/MTQ2 family protein methyltransferase n=1 Tax=Streptomyces niger TaxID=66373 RepID=UPI00069C2DE3|nr:HemK2/MTQ2 family protein methyltransferase [Streptomyces niger]